MKSLRERIYLLSAIQESVDKWTFSVRGQSKNIYKQEITRTEYKCSCPDNKTRNSFCKHLLFLISRVAMQLDIANDISKITTTNAINLWDSAKFDNCTKSWITRLQSRANANTSINTINTNISAIGTDCCICFEVMSATDTLVQCETTCKNYFHDGCINMWLSSNHSTCPLCRSDWNNNSNDNITVDSNNIVNDVVVRLLPQTLSNTTDTSTTTNTIDTTTPKKRGRKPKITSAPDNLPVNPATILTVDTGVFANSANFAATNSTDTTVTDTAATNSADTTVTDTAATNSADTTATNSTDTTVTNSQNDVIVSTPVNSGIDIVFSFDTTGSMYPCLREVRRNITNIIPKLFSEIADLRIAVIAHGDYCDAPNTIKIQDFTNNQTEIIKFINDAPQTGGGGNGGECYEYVMSESLKLSWRLDITMKSLILIGDEPPHEKNINPYKLDWREEADEFAHRNIQIFSVQCLNSGRRREFEFYSTIARITNGYHLFLDQFSYIKDMIQAVCFRQYNMGHLTTFETELEARNGGITQTMKLMFDTMLGRKTREQVEAEMRPDAYLSRYRSSGNSSNNSSVSSVSSSRRGRVTGSAPVAVVTGTEADLRPCIPSRFQVFNVSADIGIREFCDSMSIPFAKGNGYYEFVKPEIIQPGKEIVLMDRTTGNLYEGDVARFIAGIGANTEKAKLKPTALAKYRVFVQSTSVTRKLVAGQGFLYEVDTTS